MKNLKKITTLILCLVSIIASSQELRIVKGSKEKIFKSNSIFKINVSNNSLIDKDTCCLFSELYGKISSIDKDSLTIQLTGLIIHEKLEDRIALKRDYTSSSESISKTVSFDDILSLENYKSAKYKKNKRRLMNAGGILIVSSLATALNALVISDKPSKKQLFLLSGIQFGLGVTLSRIGFNKRYKFRKRHSVWKIVQ